MSGISTARLYGVSIALVSGLYSLASAAGGTTMMTGAWVMAGIGVVVLVHGVVLLTPMASGLERISGPLMCLWAAIMLANQWLFTAMAPDGGMVAIAILMLLSGLIMTLRREM